MKPRSFRLAFGGRWIRIRLVLVQCVAQIQGEARDILEPREGLEMSARADELFGKFRVVVGVCIALVGPSRDVVAVLVDVVEKTQLRVIREEMVQPPPSPLCADTRRWAGDPRCRDGSEVAAYPLLVVPPLSLKDSSNVSWLPPLARMVKEGASPGFPMSGRKFITPDAASDPYNGLCGPLEHLGCADPFRGEMPEVIRAPVREGELEAVYHDAGEVALTAS